MPFDKITIPNDLMDLKPSSDLQSVSMSSLARKGTALLRQLTDTAQAVAVKIQGHGAMVTLSQRQYDEMVALLQQLRQDNSDDGFTRALGERFDTLVATMNQPGAPAAMDAALFTEAETLNSNYCPGATETAQDSSVDPRSGRRQRSR
jgi:PHD/YefM family antitoxin component YafN of YafNO toxin-antitoxin module